MRSTVGVILAAGPSLRFDSPVHKQYLKLNGKELVYYSIKQMRDAGCFQDIIVVVDKAEYESQYISKKFSVKCILGGDTRNQSIRKALEHYKNTEQPDCIVFHDCTRPLCDSGVFSSIVSMLEDFDAVAIASTIHDGMVDDELRHVPREKYWLVRTPEAFDFKTLNECFDEKSTDTTIISQIPKTKRIKLYTTNTFDFKVTYPEDLFVAEQLINTDYESTKKDYEKVSLNGNVLLLGGSGGLGQCLKAYFDREHVNYFAPTHNELDLSEITVEKLNKVVPFDPDVILNVAAAYASDDVDFLESFNSIMDVNVKANLVLIRYAQSLGKRVNIVVLSSSSSTRGREHLTNYSASKAALNSIVESQGQILSKDRIYLNAIVPEKINTPLIEKLHKQVIDKRELLEPSEVIPVILKYCNTKESGKIVHVRKGL